MLAKALLMRKKNSDGNLIKPNVVLPSHGWIRQDDGSFYVASGATVRNKVLWQNTEGYTGQLKVSYDIKWQNSGDCGAILWATYTDSTVWYISPANNTNPNNYVHLEYTSAAGKTVQQIISSYATSTNPTWIKNLMITKV